MFTCMYMYLEATIAKKESNLTTVCTILAHYVDNIPRNLAIVAKIERFRAKYPTF